MGFKNVERVEVKDYFDSGFLGGNVALVIWVTDKNVAFLDTFHQQYFLPVEAKRAVCKPLGCHVEHPISFRYNID